MVETRVADASIRRIAVAATLLIGVAVVVIPYSTGRAFRGWMKGNHPLARPRAGLKRWGVSYQEKRANMTEVTQVIGIVLAEVARARSSGKAG